MRTLSFCLCLLLSETSWVEDKQLQEKVALRDGVPPKRFVVDLDKKPIERWAAMRNDPLFANYKHDFTSYLSRYVPKTVVPLVAGVAKQLKSKYYSDYADEMVGLAKALNVSIGDIVLANLIYQIEDVAVSCKNRNTTGPCPPNRHGPGLCTGVVANGHGDASGQIWQGRNLDWNLDASLLKYTMQVEYKRENATIFSTVQIAGQVGALHGMRHGGFSVQVNARKTGGNVLVNLLDQILLGAKCPSHALRYALEHTDNFASAEKFLSSEKLANPIYYVMAGASHGEGVILSRDRTKLVDAWHLFEKSAKDKAQINDQPDWFRLQTNYDHWEVVPSYDNRRGPGVKHVEQYCNLTVDHASLTKVMLAWPTKNHHTDVTSVMCPLTGFFSTNVWFEPTTTVIV